MRVADLGVYDEDFARGISRTAGLRNVLVHEYNDVDRSVVYASIRTCIEQYRIYLESILDFLSPLDSNRE